MAVTSLPQLFSQTYKTNLSRKFWPFLGLSTDYTNREGKPMWKLFCLILFSLGRQTFVKYFQRAGQREFGFNTDEK